jgi:aldose 1-epimerase
MNPTLSLVCDGLRCEIVPGLGAAVAGLWLDDIPVLRSSPGARLASVRDAGSYPLVPFSNRIGHARMQWKGASHTLAQNFPPEPHAIHGVGWQRPWAVMEAQAHFALARLRAPAGCSLAFRVRLFPGFPARRGHARDVAQRDQPVLAGGAFRPGLASVFRQAAT